MHFIIVGCGRVGGALVHTLAEAGHSVCVIDRNRRAFERLLPLPSGVVTLEGYGFDRDTLKVAGIDRADAFASVTSGDNTNILCARVARETFGITRVVARIYDPRRASLYERVGIPTVASVQWTTDQVLRRLLEGERIHSWTDSSGKMILSEHLLPDSLAGQALQKIEEPGMIRVIGVTRLGQAMIVTPDLIGQHGDTIHIAAHVDAIGSLNDRLGFGSTKGAHSS